MHAFFHFFGLTIPAYGFLIAFGVVIANVVAFFVLKYTKKDFNDFIDRCDNIIIGYNYNSQPIYFKQLNKTNDIKSQISEYSQFVSSANKEFAMRNAFLNIFFSDDFTRQYLDKFGIDIGKFDLPEKETLVQVATSFIGYDAYEDNNILIISEKEKKVFLPYKKSEIEDYLKQYPNKYKTYKDVIYSEFVVPLNYYQHFPVIARFREAYSLVRDREGKSIVEALKYAMDLMLKSELNPAIIASCKYQDQLDHYLECMEANSLDEFKDFEIKFDVNLRWSQKDWLPYGFIIFINTIKYAIDKQVSAITSLT